MNDLDRLLKIVLGDDGMRAAIHKLDDKSLEYVVNLAHSCRECAIDQTATLGKALTYSSDELSKSELNEYAWAISGIAEGAAFFNVIEIYANNERHDRKGLPR